MDIAQYVNRMKLANTKDLQSTFRHGLGPLMWVHPTRPDVVFLIAKLATDFMMTCADVDKALQLAKLYNETVKFLKNHPIEIRYVPPPGLKEPNCLKDLNHYRIICFTDAGFPTLHGDHIIESNVAIFGKV